MAAAADFARRWLRHRRVVGLGPLLVRSRPLLNCHGDLALRPFSSSSPPPPTSNEQKVARLGHQMPAAAVQAHLAQCGIDAHKVVRCYPAIASYSVERVQRVTGYLAGLGVDVKRVVEGHPGLLAGKVEKYIKMVQLLRENGVDVARAASCNHTFGTGVAELLPRSLLSCCEGHLLNDHLQHGYCGAQQQPHV
eukprot:EG_transcript_32467